MGRADDGTAAGLDSDVPLRAQRFQTGENAAGYLLTSVGVGVGQVDDPPSWSGLEVTINRAADRVVTDPFATPGDEVCTLTHPGSYSANAVNRFDAPPGGCVLDGDGGYFVVAQRTDAVGDDMALATTEDSAWDDGAAPGRPMTTRTPSPAWPTEQGTRSP